MLIQNNKRIFKEGFLNWQLRNIKAYTFNIVRKIKFFIDAI